MAKRGRKPKEKKGYFYDDEEQAIIDYIKESDFVAKNKIYNDILHPALTKMIESIIRRYKLYVPDEEFDQTFNDTISYLLTKINNFNPDKGYKAYSYCGTVCRNYLIFKNMQFMKEQQRTLPYYDMMDEISDNVRYSDDGSKSNNFAEVLIKETSNEIKKMVENPSGYSLSENEIKVGIALTELLDNWEDILTTDDSSLKLQKSSVLYFLREETMMTTKEVRDNMKKYKCIYNILKQAAIE